MAEIRIYDDGIKDVDRTHVLTIHSNTYVEISQGDSEVWISFEGLDDERKWVIMIPHEGVDFEKDTERRVKKAVRNRKRVTRSP